MIRRICEICGKVMDKKDYPHYSYAQFESRRFCSKQCKCKDKDYRELMDTVLRNQVKTEKQIDQCKEMGKSNNGKHNSKETEFKCEEQNPNWKGGTEKYRGKDWKIQREKALKRDGYACRRCDTKDNLTVHHLTRYSKSKDNSLDNLITLCRRCHIIHEKGYSTLIIDGEDIIIRNVPEKILNQFLEYANEEFDGNTGMTLKWLVDFYFGYLSKGHERAESMAAEALEQIAEVKAEGKQEEKKIQTVSGKELKTK